MKKLITLIALLSAAVATNAQRKHVMLEATINTPASGDVITYQVPFTEDITYKVLGPDTVAANDTLYYQDALNYNSSNVWIIYGRVKYINDTFHIVRSGLTTGSTAQNGTSNFCTRGAIITGGVGFDITKDTFYQKCNTVTITGVPDAAVGDVTYTQIASKSSLEFYPNPANNEITITYASTGKSDVVATVYDVTGRQVYTQNYGSAKTGVGTYKLGVANLNPGLYIIEVNQENNTRSIGKMNKL